MRFEFCLPTRATVVPSAPEWFHEVKYDGYRLRLERDGARVRLITKGGHDWAKRYPWIVEAALTIIEERALQTNHCRALDKDHAAQLWDRAEECRARAAVTTDAKLKAEYRELADEYLKLAQREEALRSAQGN